MTIKFRLHQISAEVMIIPKTMDETAKALKLTKMRYIDSQGETEDLLNLDGQLYSLHGGFFHTLRSKVLAMLETTPHLIVATRASISVPIVDIQILSGVDGQVVRFDDRFRYTTDMSEILEEILTERFKHEPI